MANRQTHTVEDLIDQLKNKNKIWILSGAGISAPSGIPTYRDHKGNWQAGNPVQHQDFINKESSRQRYWARSMVGFMMTHRAIPNAAHHAVTQLQESGRLSQIVTQNVDRLHSSANAKNVIDLHGRLDQITCLGCKQTSKREDYQPRLLERNPDLKNYAATLLPDGDASVDDYDMSQVEIPPCENCGGISMPDVVFFGGVVPKDKVKTAFETLDQSDCMLVIGSSLSIFSGFRFARHANQNGIPLFAVNQGAMRGEGLFDLIVPESCEDVLVTLAKGI